ncbi:MAG: hypothetical protein KDH89_09125, partial [Anaerolineae bacterium]|nr:hypothetical protein [Anaerolineae bacterium]
RMLNRSVVPERGQPMTMTGERIMCGYYQTLRASVKNGGATFNFFGKVERLDVRHPKSSTLRKKSIFPRTCHETSLFDTALALPA